jgi:hypothetical protein
MEALLVSQISAPVPRGAASPPGAVVRAYQKSRHVVHSLANIRQLSLAEVDKVKLRLDLAYIASSTLEGAAAGLRPIR